jgi:hypothetical protein
VELEEFKIDCVRLEITDIVQKYLIDGNSYFFEQFDLDEYEFKKEIAHSLGVHIRDIAIVGSGKLGFSLKPDDTEPSFFPFKEFDDGRISDLDVAIVSEKLFNIQLQNLFEFTGHYTNHDLWSKPTDRKSLALYVLKGWIKPEFVPGGYEITEKISQFQTTYQMRFGREINIGIYHSLYYFENYHKKNVENIQLNLIAAQ